MLLLEVNLWQVHSQTFLPEIKVHVHTCWSYATMYIYLTIGFAIE